MDEITFAPLRPEHLVLMHRWFSRPHMTWWTRGETYTPQMLEEKYRGLFQGEPGAEGFLIRVAGQDAGYIQWYAVAESFPEGVTTDENPLFTAHPREALAGVDLFLGEAGLVGTGLGPRVLESFLTAHVFPRFRAAVVDPMSDNARALRAFEKAGFVRTGWSEDSAYVLMLRAQGT